MDGLQKIERWFESRDWEPFPFQREVWTAYRAGESGLIHSATGTGKTLAAWLGPVSEALERKSPPGLKVLWITPLRALSTDTANSLIFPLAELGLDWRVELRTGDTSSYAKSKQLKKPPDALVTTPESLSLLLSQGEVTETFRGLQALVVDEWHELMASKRGVLTELALARVRTVSPEVRTWGVSATLGNLDQARETLLGGSAGRLVRGTLDKAIVIDSALPENMDRFPWAGHVGTYMLDEVIDAIQEARSTLVFTNVRSSAELWFQAILNARPDWKGTIELHHGSLDRDVREAVERGLKEGLLRAVVCTSSLDLGVDFTPVDRVVQIGSPKGVARLLQRAGRSGHQPGVASRITCVPTHALEMIDIAAVRAAAEVGRIEGREPIRAALDVLVQHLVTVAIGGGFEADAMRREVMSTTAFRELSDADWQWCLNFIVQGGDSLRAYPEYHKVEREGEFYRATDRAVIQRHRMQIGTIVSDSAVHVQWLSGGRIGTVEESFVSRLSPGDRFILGGKVLEFVRVKDMACLVRPAKSPKGAVPRWAWGRMPLSNELALSIREKLEEAHDGILDAPEMRTLRPLLSLQARWSYIPRRIDLLIERVQTRFGHHLFFFPIEGRLVHEGLGALIAYRLGRHQPITFSLACNDYGFELLSEEPAPLDLALADGLLAPENLAEDIVASLNSAEMAKRHFREIARVAGLVFQGYPGQPKTNKQLQASSGLFYDMFRRFDPGNRLLVQADREVLERELEQTRLARTLDRMSKSEIVITEPPRPTPFALPILVDRLRETVSSESFQERVDRMLREMVDASQVSSEVR